MLQDDRGAEVGTPLGAAARPLPAVEPPAPLWAAAGEVLGLEDTAHLHPTISPEGKLSDLF